ncbi:MtrAB system histidine kinase MtrB [Streptomyces sp. NBC_01218]|uniref:MtrAB system histidine kinase MtrB n=1 Tax=unclassified Streptomyces TaxID=2593676 RepID=UPI0023B93D53|nr:MULTISPECIES: MtrAB system histidine kinase MtrB [unclassified Streptomyces]WEH41550.1 MtrAB system histidine kinase MtrB [Streptomyces sp. AM 2-1-1]WSQ53178.1 MtrAB system histidine kinase MtrB [Streptomyces sp. NBC_01218]
MTRGSTAPGPGASGATEERAAGPGRIRRSWSARSFTDRAPGGPFPRLLLRWLRRPLLPAVRVWRRNLQLRVVAGTLLMSLTVVLLLGFVVIGQVRNGLLDAKGKAAQTQAAGGFAAAQEKANEPLTPAREEGADGTTASTSWRTDLVDQLASGGTNAFNVVALSADSVSRGTASRAPRGSGSVEASSVPDRLRESVDQGPGAFQTYSVIRYSYGKESQPGLVVGKRLYDIDHNPYELYYLFPLTQEEKSLALVKTTLATAGLFVVVLLCAIAWFVVRQVVTPVRMAAGIAERLSAGRLQERMKVTGEDDIARLGEAFNKMAQNLQLKIQQLEELSRMQRRFVSDVSHELRTPLTTVRMAADVIHEARVDFDPITGRAAELLGDQLDRFESLLSDLLEISRFDAGAAALDAEPIDLRSVVRRVIGGAEPLAERKGTRIRVIGDEQPVVAEADPRRVERVLRNLVVNAVEHGEGRDVVVRMGVAQGAVAVAVRDYGVGLKPGEATRVFNRFWRADPARARTTGGTGLGLSIAVEDARLHGGWLQAWGEPGGGSQFRLTLPRTADEPLRGSPIPLEPEDSKRNVAERERAGADTDADGRHRVMAVPHQPSSSERAALPVAARPGASRQAPASVHPAALPGSGARVVARPGSAPTTAAPKIPGQGRDRNPDRAPDEEDTRRGH